MKIHERDFYHGCALAQITNYSDRVTVEKVKNTNNVYEINASFKLVIKYSIEDGDEWNFKIKRDELLLDADSYSSEYFVALICGGQSICLLSESDINELMNDEPQRSGTIHVSVVNGGRFRVSCRKVTLSRTISQSAFPKAMFESDIASNAMYSWPYLSTICIQKNEPNQRLVIDDRAFDLADQLTHNLRYGERRVRYLSLIIHGKTVEQWSEELLRIEGFIKYLFEFDGFAVDLERMTSEEDICFEKEFVWKMEYWIDCDDGIEETSPDDEDDKDEAVNNLPNRTVSERRKAHEMHFVEMPTKPTVSIEVDVDFVPDAYRYGGWEDLIRSITAKWVQENTYLGTGTIFAMSSDSVNFNHQSHSAFYVVAGMPDQFMPFLRRELKKCLGGSVRPQSDMVIPTMKDGWTNRCHIEFGKTWDIEDAVTWFEVLIKD